MPEEQRPVAQGVDRAEVVADEHDRLPLGPHLLERLEALLLELGVTDGKRFVHEQDVERNLDRDRVSEAQEHAR